jgi:hypothetical protein
MEKDDSSDSVDKDTELGALLSAADRGMLDAIRDNLDLDTGFAQILGNLAGITPTVRATGPAQAVPGGHAHSYGHVLDPVRACEVSGAAQKIPASADTATRREPRRHHRMLTTLGLAVIVALNFALLYSLSHGAVGARSDAGATSPTPKSIAGESARTLCFVPPPRPQQFVVLAGKAGACASLRFAADSARIGGDPVISYIKNSPGGPVLLLSGFPVGTAIRFLSIGAGRSGRNCSAVSHWNHPFPSGGEQFSPGTTICITGGSGRVMLNTVQNQSSEQIGVLITWFPDLV